MKPLLFSLLLWPVLAFAQAPVIYHFEDYHPGDSMVYVRTDPYQYRGDSGTYMNWDFHAPDNLGLQYWWILSPSALTPTPPAPVNLVMKVQEGWQQSFYYYKKTAGLTELQSKNGTTDYGNRKMTSVRPIGIGTVATDTFTRPSGLGIAYGYVQLSYNGFGTLQLPSATYNDVLRIKLVTQEWDTLHNTETYEVSYLWLIDSLAAPLYIWDSVYTRNTSGSSFYKEAFYLKNMYRHPFTAVPAIANTNADVNACFSDDALHISAGFDARHFSLNVYNTDDRQVYTAKDAVLGNGHPCNAIGTFSPGMYIVVLADTRNAANILVKKVVKE